jgi:hypothetical protein
LFAGFFTGVITQVPSPTAGFIVGFKSKKESSLFNPILPGAELSDPIGWMAGAKKMMSKIHPV